MDARNALEIFKKLFQRIMQLKKMAKESFKLLRRKYYSVVTPTLYYKKNP